MTTFREDGLVASVDATIGWVSPAERSVRHSEYSYDARGQVAQIITDSTGLAVVTTFLHDDQGRRVQRATADFGQAASSSHTIARFAYTKMGDGRPVVIGSSPARQAATQAAAYAPLGVTVYNLAGRAEFVATLDAASDDQAAAALAVPMESLLNPAARGMPATTDPAMAFTDAQKMTHSAAGTRPLSRTHFTKPGFDLDQSGTKTFAYALGRLARVVDATHTAVAYGYDAIGQQTTVSKGPNPDPAASLSLIESVEYDGGQPGGNGFITARTRFTAEDGSPGSARTTTFIRDCLGNALTATGAAAPYSAASYNTLGQVTALAAYAVPPAVSPQLAAPLPAGDILRRDTAYDEAHRPFRVTVTDGQAASPSALHTNFWYDAEGRAVKVQGTDLAKLRYDALGRPTERYTLAASAGEGYPYAGSNPGGFLGTDPVISESRRGYGPDGRVAVEVSLDRWDAGTGAGPLAPAFDTSAFALSVAPGTPGRPVYTAFWRDPLGRPTKRARFATPLSGGTISRVDPGLPVADANGSDAQMVAHVWTATYGVANRLKDAVDPKDILTSYTYDDSGRVRGETRRVSSGLRAPGPVISSTETECDCCRITATIRQVGNDTASRQRVEVGYLDTVPNPPAGFHGALAIDNHVPIALSDPIGITTVQPERTWLRTNLLGEPVEVLKPGGLLMEIGYDARGRPIGLDTVWAGAGPDPFDATTTRLAIGLDPLGRPGLLTSFGPPVGGVEQGVNQLHFEFNGFGQPTLSESRLGPNFSIATAESPRLINRNLYATLDLVDGRSLSRLTERSDLVLVGDTNPNSNPPIAPGGVDPIGLVYNDLGDPAHRVLLMEIPGPTPTAQPVSIIDTPTYFGIYPPNGRSMPEVNVSEPPAVPFCAGSTGCGPFTLQPNSGGYLRDDQYDRPSGTMWLKEFTPGWDDPIYQQPSEYDAGNGPLQTPMIYNPPYQEGPHAPPFGFTPDGEPIYCREHPEEVQLGNGVAPPPRVEAWTYDGRGNWLGYARDVRALQGSDLTSQADRPGLVGAGSYLELRSFSPNNRMTQRTIYDHSTTPVTAYPAYDPAGNLADDGVAYDYQFDHFGRLARVFRRAADGSRGPQLARFEYDALGRRDRSEYRCLPDGTLLTDHAIVERYHNDEFGRIIDVYTQTVPDGGPVPPARLAEHYVYPTTGLDGTRPYPALDVPLLRDRFGGAGGPRDRVYYLPNARGDVVALVERRAGGSVVAEQVRYSPFGRARVYTRTDINGDGEVNGNDISDYINLWYLQVVLETPGLGHFQADFDGDGEVNGNDISDYINAWYQGVVDGGGVVAEGELSGPEVDNRVGYAGYRWDPYVKLYHVRHRVYRPDLGLWLQPDPAGYVDGMNLYAYCGNRPLQFTDPLGLWSIMRAIWTGDFNAADEVYNGALNGGGSTIPGVVIDVADAVDTPTGRRVLGTAQAVGGLVTTAGGVATGWTGVGLGLVAVGADMTQAGARQAVSGQWTPSLLSEGIDTGLQQAGVNPDDRAVLTNVLTATIQAVSAAQAVRTLTPASPAPVEGGACQEPVTQVGSSAETPSYPGTDVTRAPPGTLWRGRPGSVPGDGDGNYYNPNTGESFRPDINHPEPIGPHWDYRAPDGGWHRIMPDGTVVPKS